VNPANGRWCDEITRGPARRVGVKGTGFPIAKMAAKFAVGYTLDEIPNDSQANACVLWSHHRLRGRQDPQGSLKVPGADEGLGRR